MKIVVIGGSGNIGTAVIERLRGHELVGVCRRVPDREPPYDAAQWHHIDVSTPESSDLLVRVLTDADAVVHAAWAIQPSHDPEYLHRVNVEGSRRVIEAVVKAKVPHLVYLSSIGAYSPAEDSTRIDETWPTDGVSTSGYSRDKSEVERILDGVQAARPELTVTRLRPGLMLQRRSASEVARYFLGPLAPRLLFKAANKRLLPAVPLPRSMTLQFVHTKDVAEAVAAAIDRRYDGPVNLAAEPPLPAAAVADLVGRRLLPTSERVLRPLAAASWRAHLQPTPPGWLDLAMASPVLNTDVARRELGWQPKLDAAETLRDLVGGLADNAGVSASPALRPGTHKRP